MTGPVSIDAYLAALTGDRRRLVATLLGVVRDNLPAGYAEGVQYGMPSFFVPHERYPAGYHADPRQPVPFLSIGSQKQHVAIYFFGLYAVPAEAERFAERWLGAGHRLDMGKSCVRVKSLDAVPLSVVGEAVRRLPVNKFLSAYEAALATTSAAKKAIKETGKKTAKEIVQQGGGKKRFGKKTAR